VDGRSESAHTVFPDYISFDEAKHTYTVDGKILQSVTHIVENCFPKFDAELHAKYTAAKMGITPEKVIMMWEQKGKESRELGTAMHQKIESYYQGKDSREDDSYRLFKMFAEKKELVPYRTEWAVYDTDHNIAGTIDFVDYQNGEYTIYDWKRSDKIIANGMPVKVSKYQEKGLYPLEHLENCAYYHYALQLSLYKFILERNYNMKISKLRLGIFHPTYDKPYVLEVPYLENEVNTLMGLRSEIIF
jgi:ATP-dependent exoDNAse (exonuclease V) beta subunit